MRGIAMVLAWVLVLAVLFVAVGFALPSDLRTTRSVVIAAKPERIYEDVARLATWPEWTEWSDARDPSAKFVFGEVEEGLGATWSWTAASLGNGSLEITAADPFAGVRYRLETEEGYAADGSIRFEPDPAGTRVVWSDVGDFPLGPLGGWARLFLARGLEGDLGAALEKSLARLEERAEARE